jgi:hypothetical protein
MRRPILALSQLVLALGLAHAMAAQGPPPRVGDRIRLTVPSLAVKPFVGIVERLPADTILVRTGADVLSAFPLDQVDRLELSRGTRSPGWSRAALLWMPFAGFSVGFALGAAKPASRTDPAESGLVIGVMGAVVGLLAGAVTTIAAEPREEWATVPARRGSRTSLSPSLYVAPATRGLTLGLRAGF